MGTYVCFDRHIHIGYESRTNGILSQLGYVDINEQMLNEIVNNKRLKCIQISECLPDEAYQKNRPDSFSTSGHYVPTFSFLKLSRN